MHKICTKYAQNIDVFGLEFCNGCWSCLQSKQIIMFFKTKILSVLVHIFLYAHHLGARGPRRCDFSRNVHIFRMCIFCAYFDEMCIFLMKCAYFWLPDSRGTLYPSPSVANGRAKEMRDVVKWNRI